MKASFDTPPFDKGDNNNPQFTFVKCSVILVIFFVIYMASSHLTHLTTIHHHHQSQIDPSYSVGPAGETRCVFDPIAYADRYPDLKIDYGYNKDQLFAHFRDHGVNEGRSACA